MFFVLGARRYRRPDACRPAVDRRKSSMQDRGIRQPKGAVHCRICTILIGQGYEERLPIRLTNGRGFICWQCYASVRRQTARRAAEQRAPNATIR